LRIAGSAAIGFDDAFSEAGEVHLIDQEGYTECAAWDDVCPVDMLRWKETA
jgi:hypothetical protein